MKIAKNDLQYALKKISVANGKNNLVSIEIAGVVAGITSFDGAEVQMQQTLKVTADEAENGKKYVIPFGKLQDVVNVWKDDEIVFTENGGLIVLSAPKSKTQVALPFKTEMPELKIEGEQPTGTPVVFKQEDLARGIKELLPLLTADKYMAYFAVPFVNAEIQAKSEEERPFNEPEPEEKVEPVPNTTRIWGTDGARCHFIDLPGAFSKPIALPKVFVKIVSVLKGDLTCVPMGENYLLIKDNENTLTVVSLAAKNMKVAALQGILDKVEEDKCASVETTTADLVAALNLINVVTTDEKKRLSFDFAKGVNLALAISDSSGKGSTEIGGQIECSADMFAPAYSTEQLLIMCQSVQSEKIRLYFSPNQLFLMTGNAATYCISRFNS